jgi:hypothetical protein
VLLTHLLKWQIQTERRSKSWSATIEVQRLELTGILRSMPSLRDLLRDSLPEMYAAAVTKAVGETGLPKGMFPANCPFSLEQTLDTGFLPD